MRRLLVAAAGALLALGLVVPTGPAAAQTGNTLDVNGAPNSSAGERQSVAEGGTATLKAVVMDGVTPKPGVNIDFEIEKGPNDGGVRDNGGTGFVAPVDFTCTTGTDGSCTVTYVDDPNNNPTPNTDQIRAWIDGDGIDDTVEADMDEGVNEVSNPDPVNPEPNNTDAVLVQWVAPAAALLDVEPDSHATQKGVDQVLTARVTTKTGRPVSGQEVDYHTESPTNRMNNNGSCVSASDGTCTVTDKNSGTSTDTIRFWLEDGGAPGVPDEADMGEGRDETKTAGDEKEPDGTDVVNVQFVDKLYNLNVEPETFSADVGDTITLQANLTDKDGAPVASARIGFLAKSGPNVNTRTSCTTDALGNCSTQVTSSQAGTDEWLGWYDVNGDGFANNEADTSEGQNDGEFAEPGSGLEPDATDVVAFTYEEFCPGHRNDPRHQVVGTNRGEVLAGTKKADVICGLGGGDTLRGKGASDVLIGGINGDQLFGGAGGDQLLGQGGNDNLNGGSGRDKCKQGAGRGTLVKCES